MKPRYAKPCPNCVYLGSGAFDDRYWCPEHKDRFVCLVHVMDAVTERVSLTWLMENYVESWTFFRSSQWFWESLTLATRKGYVDKCMADRIIHHGESVP